MAVAAPLTGVEGDVVRVVVAAERERDAIDRDPIELTGVAIRLLDLADQGAVHQARPSGPPGPGGGGTATRRPAPPDRARRSPPKPTSSGRIRHPANRQGAAVPSRPK